MMTLPSIDAMPSIGALMGANPPTTALGSADKICETHGAYVSTGYRLNLTKPAREVWSVCPGCKAESDRAASKKDDADRQAALKSQIEAMLEQTAIPPRFIGKTFDSYRADSEGQERALRVCREYAGNFARHLRTGGSLILSGQPGTGKSHLAGAVLQAILPQHVGAYVTLMDLIRALRDTWRRDSAMTESQLLAKLEAIPLLVIDEVGVQYGTDGERSIMFDVLDRRYRNMRPSILMTNLSKDEFRVAIGDRVFDRLTEVARWVPFEWASYRTQARKEMRDAA
jgi:DNA replication protein DnaC